MTTRRHPDLSATTKDATDRVSPSLPHERQARGLLRLSFHLASAVSPEDVLACLERGVVEDLGYPVARAARVVEAHGSLQVHPLGEAGNSAPPPAAMAHAYPAQSEWVEGRFTYRSCITPGTWSLTGLSGGSEAVLPIRAAGRVAAVLAVASPEESAFEEADFELLTAVTSLAGLALERLESLQSAGETEARFQALTENLPIGLYRTTPDGRILYANPALVTLLGYPDRESLLSANAASFYVDERDRQRWKEEMDANGRVVSQEARLRRHDGEVIWVLDSAYAVRGPRGEVLYYEGALEDITARKEAEEALRAQKEFIDLLVDSSVDGILAFDRECRYTLWNRGMERISGMPREQVLGRCAFDVFPFLVDIGEDAYFHAALEGKTAIAHDRPYAIPETGRQGYFEGYYSPIRNAAGDVVGGLAIIRDITERKRKEEENALLAAFLRENPNPVVACDARGALQYHNPATERVVARLGLERKEALLPPDHVDLVQRALETGTPQEADAKLGEHILHWSYFPQTEYGVVHLYAVDVTEVRRHEARLRHEAHHDPLTGLANRARFLQELEHALHRAHRRPDLAVLYIDLNRFKQVNDRLGHLVGDQVLAEVARRIVSGVRQTDLVARLGGDEFAVLVEEVGRDDDVAHIAQRISRAISRPIPAADETLQLKASIGIAWLASYTSAEAVLEAADQAMYRAKGAGEAFAFADEENLRERPPGR